MTKTTLLKELKKLESDINSGRDYESDHARADELLIQYINNKEIEIAYDKVGKWYA